MNSVYYFAKYDADDTGNVVHAHESFASDDTPWGSGNGLREPCGIRVIVGDVESPTVDCPADLITNTVQLPTAMYNYDNLPPNSGLQVGESFAEVDLFYGDAQFMDNIVPLAGTDDLSALFVTMKIISRGSNASTPTGVIDEGMTEFNIGTTVVEYKVMDGSGYTAMWTKCEMPAWRKDSFRSLDMVSRKTSKRPCSSNLQTSSRYRWSKRRNTIKVSKYPPWEIFFIAVTNPNGPPCSKQPEQVRIRTSTITEFRG